jgi:hypothetical protein
MDARRSRRFWLAGWICGSSWPWDRDGAKLTAVNFQDYSMKSTKMESYPQGALRLLKHDVIGFRFIWPAPVCDDA